MSKLLANQISNYNDNGPVEAKDGINVPTGKPFQVAGGAGTSGQYLTSTGSSIAWSTLPTIPAAQVQTDWNASGTIAEILNKPTLATVATSGSYTDLLNTPTIPSAQVQSDWNASGTLAEILNKPTLFSGSYNDLTDKPTIPSAQIQSDWNQSTNSALDFIKNKPTIPTNLADLANVSTTAPNNNEVLKWNGTNWAPAADATGGGGGGSTTFLGLTDTPANFTSQAGKYLKVNAGATALEFVTLPVDPDTNTNDYVSSASLSGNTLTLGRTGSQSLADLTVDLSSLGGGGATVTTDDSAPSSPSDGDLWWKSDEGRLKVYYADANSSQWVDASPPTAISVLTAGTANVNVTVDSTRTTVSGPLRASGGVDADFDPTLNAAYDLGQTSNKWKDLYLSGTVYAPSTSQTTTNGTHGINLTTTTSGSNVNAIEIQTDNGTASAVRWRFTPPGHFIPNVNAAYDIGNAEYKVRHLFLSDNTMYFQGDFLKVAQHNSGGSAQSPSYLIPLAKLKDALNASNDYEAFKTAILAITDAT